MARSILLSILCVLLFAACNAQINGLWYWTWSTGINGNGVNLGTAFSGWTDPDQAISESNSIKDKLPGSKYIALGGGNSNGRWSAAVLTKISTYCSQRKFSGYAGISFDIEEGDAGLAGRFQSAFAACKSGGYKVLVSISHSAPYGFTDAAALMNSFFGDGNIDYLSPQLYTSGNERSNDWTTAYGVQWSSYGKSRAQIVPSLVSANLYGNAQQNFSSMGVQTHGFVRWSQNG